MRVEGITAEGRNIILLKIGNSPNGTETPALWIDAGVKNYIMLKLLEE